MRAGAAARSAGSSSAASTMGATTLTANVSSRPSGVSWRSGAKTPALATNTSRRGRSRTTSAASPRAPATEPRSASQSAGAAACEDAARTAARAAAPRPGSRPCTSTSAPSSARRTAVSSPMPRVAPVTSATRPSMHPHPARKRSSACLCSQAIPPITFSPLRRKGRDRRPWPAVIIRRRSCVPSSIQRHDLRQRPPVAPDRDQGERCAAARSAPCPPRRD